jgi:hypothetical protein
MLLPALLPLLDDPATSAGAFRIAAQLAAAAAAAAGGAPAAANGNGVAHDSSGPADVLLSKMAAVLDDRGAAGPDEEVVVLDAAHHLALPSPASAALLAAPAAAGLLQSVCSKALGRTTPPEVRLAALHALASAAGLERAGEARDRSAALLPQAAEERLRQGVYGAVAGAAGGVGGARTPAEAVWQLLQQPFGDMRAAVYRCVVCVGLGGCGVVASRGGANGGLATAARCRRSPCAVCAACRTAGAAQRSRCMRGLRRTWPATAACWPACAAQTASRGGRPASGATVPSWRCGRACST